MRDRTALFQLQSLPLEVKIHMSEQRIMEWYRFFGGKCYISFSGGKDSTVLSHLVRNIYPNVPLVFANTGLEFPEIQNFARKMGAEFVRPKMRFDEVISTYGYPVIGKEVAEAIHFARRIIPEGGSEIKQLQTGRTVWPAYSRKRQELEGKRSGKRVGESNKSEICGSQFNKLKWLPLCHETQFLISHYCCKVIKKGPMHKYQRKTGLVPFIGTMAEESRIREQAWFRHGCNAFEGNNPTSQPMSLWTEQDVLHYVKEYGIELASVYGDVVEVDDSGHEYYQNLLGEQCQLKCTGCQRTGCIFCGFSVHLEKGETRFQRLAKTHPRQYEYCMMGGQWVDNPKYDPTATKMDGEWKNWNPKKIWVPSKHGLGMKKVFDDCNQIYGRNFIRYD